MTELIIGKRAIEFIKQALAKEHAKAMRIFISGGGCCRQFEIAPVEKPLTGDISYSQGGINVHIDKELVENTSSVEITFDENRGLLIEFR